MEQIQCPHCDNQLSLEVVMAVQPVGPEGTAKWDCAPRPNPIDVKSYEFVIEWTWEGRSDIEGFEISIADFGHPFCVEAKQRAFRLFGLDSATSGATLTAYKREGRGRWISETIVAAHNSKLIP